MVNTARRLVFPGIKEVDWEPLALPTELQPTEVLVRTARTVISAGTEIAVYSGTHIGYSIPGAQYPHMPYYPGFAAAGTVEAVGSAVTTLAPGDRVMGKTGHQDWVVVDIARENLDCIPEGVSSEAACLGRLATVSMQSIRLAGVKLGEHVAVFGQGLFGQFASQIAGLDGAVTAIAVDVLDSRLEVARRHGATHVVNPSREDLAERIAAATDGHGVDVAIEATGDPLVINDALHVAAWLGRVILLGSPRGRLEIDPYTDIHSKGVAVIGAHSDTTAREANVFHRWTDGAHRSLVLELLRQGRLEADGLITTRVPADEAPSMYPALMNHPEDHLGVIIQWDDAP